MKRSTHRRAVVLGAGLALAVSACGNAAESGVEQLIESQGGGDVDLDLDGDGGFSVQTEEGGMSIDEDGNFVITDADGSVVTGNADSESGEYTVESDDGTFSSGATDELPDEWPSDVPEPGGLAINSATVIASDAERVINVVGEVDGDDFAESYGSALMSAGFDEDSTFTADGTINNSYSNDEWTVTVFVVDDGTQPQATVSMFSNN